MGIEEAIEAGTQRRGRRCVLVLSVAVVLTLLAAIVAVLYISALRARSLTSAPEKHAIEQFGQASESEAFTPAPNGGSCSENDQAILSKLPGGSGKGSLGLATYQCFMQSWSIISLVDTDAFTKCLNAKTAVSTSCGTCFAD